MPTRRCSSCISDTLDVSTDAEQRAKRNLVVQMAVDEIRKEISCV